MCGRFALFTAGAELEELLGASLAESLIRPRYNIAPGTQILSLRLDSSGRRRFSRPLWGLVPSWAKDRRMAYRMINARAETVAEKPAFRSSFRHRRCLIPADGFYEWQTTASGKQPYFFCRPDRRPFAFAGLWESWHDPVSGDSLESATIIVTSANDLVRPIHDRMPVILEPEHYGLWLDPVTTRTEALHPLLRPVAADWLTRYPVAPRVNASGSDDAALIAPIRAG